MSTYHRQKLATEKNVKHLLRSKREVLKVKKKICSPHLQETAALYHQTILEYEATLKNYSDSHSEMNHEAVKWYSFLHSEMHYKAIVCYISLHSEIYQETVICYTTS